MRDGSKDINRHGNNFICLAKSRHSFERKTTKFHFNIFRLISDADVALAAANALAAASKMMEEMNVATDESYDSLDEHYDRPAERWAPLGAAHTPVPGGEEYQ